MKKKVTVTTAPLEAGCSSESKIIDWRNSSDRKWLMNHLHWAMNNKQLVALTPESI